MSIYRRIAVSAALFVSFTAYATNHHYQPFFESPEHMIIGNNVKIYSPTDPDGKAGRKILLENGLNITYGEIVTMGDFYEIPNMPISQGQSSAERNKRFMDAFNSLSTNPDSVSEAEKILSVIHNVEKTVNDGRAQGKTAEEIYGEIANDANRQYNCITGGGCTKVWWVRPGRFLQLSKFDYDHFGADAWMSYQTGHDLAVLKAIEAGKQHDEAGLETAYAMNAFACHFLTDRFAAGHMRTPRKKLVEEVKPGVAGSLLSSYMHTEENYYGLHVHNLLGNHWQAYGDRSYLNQKNSESRAILDKAMQISADQIYDAYQTGKLQDDQVVNNYIPIPDEVDNHAVQDISPLFYWDESTHTLMRRSDVANYYDRNWTGNWWGWSTLLKLARQRGMPTEGQSILATSSLAKEALASGIITDKEIAATIR